MSRASDLYALQEVDAELTDRRTALEQVEAELGGRGDLDVRIADLATNRARLAELQAEQRDLDLQAQEQREHVDSVERKLYGGSVGNPRELVALQEDVEQLRAALSHTEDRLLDILTQLEEIQSAVRTDVAALAANEGEWLGRQEQLTAEQAILSAAVRALSQRWAAAAARVSPPDLSLYQTLTQMKQGRAVARAERGMCLACRINQPLNVMQRARSGQELVQCASCERILFAG